ncbi:aminotransferase, partial [Dissophora ornata]
MRKTLGSASEIITSLTSKSSNATLLDYPTGAYTGMRTFDKIGIMDFTGHAARLATSLQQIVFPGTTDSSAHEIKEEDVAATVGLAALRDTDTMKKEATDLVRAGLKFYYKQLKEGLKNGELAAAVTAVGETKEPTLIAHFEPLRAPKSSRCKVQVHGSPRHLATAKDSQWVRDRKALEDALDKDSNEALLVDNETQDVYEGLSSNFFAFDRKRQTLLTAPMGSVLQGTIQKVVMNICKAENISVAYEFPNLKNIDDWEGAFISSKS